MTFETLSRQRSRSRNGWLRGYRSWCCFCGAASRRDIWPGSECAICCGERRRTRPARWAKTWPSPDWSHPKARHRRPRPIRRSLTGRPAGARWSPRIKIQLKEASAGRHHYASAQSTSSALRAERDQCPSRQWPASSARRGWSQQSAPRWLKPIAQPQRTADRGIGTSGCLRNERELFMGWKRADPWQWSLDSMSFARLCVRDSDRPRRWKCDHI